MNRRAGGNENGRASSNERNETSDAFEMKALAASARANTPPSPRARASELSGVVGRRDSVVGMRVLQQAPRQDRGTVSWSWVALGCVSVLVPGTIGILYLNHASAAPTPAIHAAARPADTATTANAALEIKPITHEPIALPEAEPPAVARKASKAEALTARTDRAAHHHPADGKRAPSTAEPASDSAPTAAATDRDDSAERPTKIARKGDDSDDGDKAEKSEASSKAEKKAEAEEAPAEDEPPAGAPKTVRKLQATLSRLESRVDQCHSRFQVDGTAEVKVLVSPAGTVESLLLKGDFEGTPTGDCIVRQLSAASFPSFDGSDAIRISHSFSLE